jgi:crotonobetainyl-CoA:carnitine CoA-transferase CaiB-like acyl-CoA transferase
MIDINRPKHAEEAFNLAQTVATEMVQTIEHPTIGAMRVAGLPLKFSLTRCSLDRPPPLLGEHTNSVLRDIIGLSEQEIESLRNEKVI